MQRSVNCWNWNRSVWLRWFSHIECKDDASWVRCCRTMEDDVTRNGLFEDNMVEFYRGFEEFRTVPRSSTIKEFRG